MRFSQFASIIILVLIISCSTSTDTDEALDFNNMNIEFYKTGGWTNTYTLRIDSTGFVKVYVHYYYYSSSIAIKDGDSANLTDEEKNLLSVLFYSFSDFKKFYEPEHSITDQNYYTIILKNGTSLDTTAVYDPPHCNLPKNLNRIISFMNDKIDDLLTDHASAK